MVEASSLPLRAEDREPFPIPTADFIAFILTSSYDDHARLYKNTNPPAPMNPSRVPANPSSTSDKTFLGNESRLLELVLGIC